MQPRGYKGNWHFALRNLIFKDFRVRYRNMALGLLWSVINPLVMLGVLTFLFTYVYPNANRPFFPVFILIGLVTFNLFSRTVVTGTVSIVHNAPLIKKVAFPRVLIPISAVISQLLDGFIMLCLLVVFVLLFHVPITPEALWVPVIYATEIAFIIGVSLITCALNVYYRDMQYLVESVLTILFWLTPVFYPLDLVRRNVSPLVYQLYLLNPLAGCIDSLRRAILDGLAPDPAVFGTAAAMTVLAVAVGWRVFSRMQRLFADFT